MNNEIINILVTIVQHLGSVSCIFPAYYAYKLVSKKALNKMNQQIKIFVLYIFIALFFQTFITILSFLGVQNLQFILIYYFIEIYFITHFYLQLAEVDSKTNNHLSLLFSTILVIISAIIFLLTSNIATTMFSTAIVECFLIISLSTYNLNRIIPSVRELKFIVTISKGVLIGGINNLFLTAIFILVIFGIIDAQYKSAATLSFLFLHGIVHMIVNYLYGSGLKCHK